MNCLAAVVTVRPLVLHVSLSNPFGETAPLHVPRSLKPLGAFISLQLKDAGDALMYETPMPKFAPKLDPSQPSSYVAIDPGYSYGVVLECGAPHLPPGEYRAEVTYSNLQYRGFAGCFLGDQRCRTSIRFAVP